MPLHMPSPHPRIREGLRAEPAGDGLYVLFDSFRFRDTYLSLSSAALHLIALLDGTRSVSDIQTVLTTQGLNLERSHLIEFLSTLERAGFLDGPEFRAYLTGPVRRPVCGGCYPAEPENIALMLDRLFTAPGGAGLPGSTPVVAPPGRLRAILVPHMDYTRGGITYGWGFRELIERTDSRLFVIIATSHYSTNRFSLTRMNFETPLGVVETDQKYIDRILSEYGDGVFSDPFAHLPEHSIELEVLLLQHLFADREPFRIVPLLVGSFHDCVATNTEPDTMPDIHRMIEALRKAEAAAGEPVCYLISGDLAHIGPKFDDPEPVSADQLNRSRQQDSRILDRLAAADGPGFFRTIAQEHDARRICGLSPVCVTLATTEPSHGRILHYQQYQHPQGHESVSFAAAAFYSE